MSEELEEAVEEVEIVDLEALSKQYEVKGFFTRFAEMCKGLGKPHNTREYKLARIEMQRMMAPVMAILFVGILLAVMIVLTAGAGAKKKGIEITIAQVENNDEPIEETPEEEPPDEPPPEPPPMEDVEIMVDNPTPGPVSTLTPVAAPPATQVSVKPATQDTVAFVNSPVKMKSMVGSRTPGSIGAATRGGGKYGDASTEAAVYKALRWLKKTQQPDGSWQSEANCHYKSKAACTGLAVLTFLAHGETPKQKEFGPTVKKAIEWLCANQKQTKAGTWTINDAGAEEYGLLIATYALCEAYGMTKNPNLKTVAERFLQRIVDNQSPTGGWNYGLRKESTAPDDISYGGWCIQAIKAGKLAGIHVDGMEECIKKAIKCLKTRNYNKRTGFAYRPDRRHYESYAGLGGVGCLAMQLLGYGKEPEVRNALNVMKDWRPNFDNGEKGDKSHERPKGSWTSPQYYYYYASQCKFQAGMAENAAPADQVAWEEWNKAMKAFYPSNMKDAGEIPGPDGKPRKCAYWVNKDRHSCRPVMDTCLAALQLMVYYRYLPQATLKADDEKSTSAAEAATDKSNDIDVSVDI
ncbi:MAG: terpene cyclase/mutase family protein [Kiritimatiellae bacterium]|nr:terpene cyclase/mutase family protein [Kiritimatiellia bacterium]